MPTNPPTPPRRRALTNEPTNYPTSAVPALDLPDRRLTPTTLHVSPEASELIAAGSAHVQALAESDGYGSDQHRRAEQSWRDAITQLFSLGRGAVTHISSDGQCSLLVRTGSGDVSRLIFRGGPRRCTAGDDCPLVVDEHGDPLWFSKVADHNHAFPIDAGQ